MRASIDQERHRGKFFNLGDLIVTKNLGVTQFIHQYQLPADFYVYSVDHTQLWPVLSKSSHYLSIQNKFNALLRNSPPTAMPITDPYEAAISEWIVPKLARCIPGFNRARIVFKQFGDLVQTPMAYTDGGVLYFHEKRLQIPFSEAWRCELLGRSLELLKVSLTDLVTQFNLN